MSRFEDIRPARINYGRIEVKGIDIVDVCHGTRLHSKVATGPLPEAVLITP